MCHLQTLLCLSVALSSLVAMVQVASADSIYYQSYTADFVNQPNNYFCQGTPLPVPSELNFTGGECNFPYYNSSHSNAYYCDGNGAAVIVIQFSSGNCAPESVTSMTRIPTTCGTGSVYGQWQCQGTDILPNAWTFPPEGQWDTAVTQYNNTWDGTAYGTSVPACGALPPSARAVTVQSAYYVGCQNYAGISTQTPRQSSQSFRGGFTAAYNDYDCAPQDLQTLTQGFNQGCINGVYNSGIQGGPWSPPPPMNQPFVLASRSYYAADEEGNYCGTLLSTTYFASTCFDSLYIVCDGGEYIEMFHGTQNGGACNGPLAPGYPIIQNTTSGNCQQIRASDKGFSYSCTETNSNTFHKHKRTPIKLQ